ncbi:FAD dependent oxidoreductase [Clostridium celatum DSM 1785]|nr:FAD dependent oxidoreductase [Clostridium celatum DSM 1785]
MDYDVLVLGGGIIGCAVAYELSKYNLNIAVIEKEYDIADDVSFVNTSIVYDGSETSNNVMAGLEYIGNILLEDLCEKFDVPFKRIGALRVVNDNNGVVKLGEMYDRAIRRGIDGVYLIEPDEVYEIEPNINMEVKKGLYSQNVAIVAPYDLAIAYAEVAFDNGVNFRLEEEVLTIQNITKGFRVVTNKNKFMCKVVINTIANEIYINEQGIVEEKESNNDVNAFKNMSYILIDDNYENKLQRIVTKTFDKDTFVVSTPILNGGSLIGIKSTEKTSLDDNLEYAGNLLKE